MAKALLGTLLQNNSPSVSAPITLSQLWRRYECTSAKHLDNRLRTRDGDTGRMRILLAYFGPECEVATLTEDKFLSYRNKRLQGGIEYEGKATEAVGPRSVQADFRLLYSLFKWACTATTASGKTLLDRNPLDGFVIGREKNPRRPVATEEQFLATQKAIQELIEEAETEKTRRKWLRLEIALVLAEATGRRIGAISQLTWANIDLRRGFISWPAETDKTGISSRIPMTKNLQSELRSYRRKSGSKSALLLFPKDSNPNIPVKKDVLSQWLLVAEAKARLEKLDGSLWHAYRRRWATIRKTLPIKDVAAAGGWSEPTTLLRCYQQPDEKTLLEVMNATGRKKSPSRTKQRGQNSPSNGPTKSNKKSRRLVKGAGTST